MGMEFTVNSLEEMCELMCNNRIPRQKKKKDTKGKTNRQAEKSHRKPI